MKKLSVGLVCAISVVLSGCTDEEINLFKSFSKEVKNTPARATVSQIIKLVKANSLFNTSGAQYEYTPLSLKQLLIENEYEIFVEEHWLYYCYDRGERDYEGVRIRDNFAVLAVDGTQDVFGGGTPAMRPYIEPLPDLPEWKKNADGFVEALAIVDGTCFEIENHAPAPEQSKFSDEKLLDQWNQIEEALENQAPAPASSTTAPRPSSNAPRVKAGSNTGNVSDIDTSELELYNRSVTVPTAMPRRTNPVTQPEKVKLNLRGN